MRVSSPIRKVLLLVASVSVVAAIKAEDAKFVPFPAGFRSWQHVKSVVIGPAHPLFAKRGGIHHYYANDLAVAGYRTGKFATGAVIVDEGVFAKDGEGATAGFVMENGRRSVDVMVKNDELYKETGGWGFQHFDKEETTGRLTASDQMHCHACHASAKDRDHVFSQIRP